jgi:hypothetical protein
MQAALYVDMQWTDSRHLASLYIPAQPVLLLFVTAAARRCPSCVPGQSDLLAAEAAAELTRQLSAPAAALRAAAAAAQQEARQHQHQQPGHPSPPQQPASMLLPALSVVNHATGDHIIINSLDKVSGRT